jgi:hypothetical protein
MGKPRTALSEGIAGKIGARAKRDVGSILGFVAILDADGGNQQALVRFSESDTTSRQVAEFSVKKDEPRILRIHNASGTIDYAIKIAKAE